MLLAPLRYGAGVKGKILDSWHNWVPVVTTPIGGEVCASFLINLGNVPRKLLRKVFWRNR